MMDSEHAPAAVRDGHLHFACPGCGHPGFIPLELGGQNVTCPECQSTFQAPPAPAADREPATERKGAVKVLDGTEGRAAGMAVPRGAVEVADVGQNEWGGDHPQGSGEGLVQDGRARLIRTAVAVAAAVAGVLLLVGISSLVRGNGGDAAASVDDPAPDEEKADRARVASFARYVLGLSTWEAAVPLVRSPARVRRLMERYYRDRPWLPVQVESLLSFERRHIDGVDFIEATLGLVPGAVPDQTATVVIEETGSGLLLDWELLSEAPAWSWQQFLNDRPEEGEIHRLSVTRSSLPDSTFRNFGIDPDQGEGFRLWHRDAATSAFAVLPADSEVVADLLDLVAWDAGARLVLDVRWDREFKGEPYLTIVGVVAEGWILGGEDAARRAVATRPVSAD